MVLRSPAHLQYKIDKPVWKMEHQFDEVETVYSAELITLLKSCLDYYPNRRPTPKDIVDRFHDNKDKWGHMHGKEALEWEARDEWLHWKGDGRWSLGEKFTSGDTDDVAQEKKDEAKHNAMAAFGHFLAAPPKGSDG